MRVFPIIGLVAAGATLLITPSAAHAQAEGRRVTIEARGGLNVPTFGISDAVDAGPSFGLGAAVELRPRVYLLGDVDLGFHSGNGGSNGVSRPDVKVYHYMAKLGYGLLAERSGSPWSVIVNAGAGAMTFDVDGGASNTYPAINVGAKIAYRVSPRVSLLLSPQGDIAFSKEDELGTTNAWVWPFTAGIRVGL